MTPTGCPKSHFGLPEKDWAHVRTSATIKTIGIAITAVLAAILLPMNVAAATPGQPPAPLASPDVTCVNLSSVDTNMEDAFDAIKKMTVVPQKLSGYLDLYTTLGGTPSRASIAHMFEAQLTWDPVPGATSYIIESAYRKERETENLVSPSNATGHTISPWLLENMPLDYMSGGGYLHTTYYLYAVAPDGRRSLPAEVKIRVTRGVDGQSYHPKLSLPSVTCGHVGDEPVFTSRPPQIPTAVCTQKSFDGVGVIRVVWNRQYQAIAYRVGLFGEDGDLIRYVMEGINLDEDHVYQEDVDPDGNAGSYDDLRLAVQAQFSDGSWSPPGNMLSISGSSSTVGLGCEGWDAGIPYPDFKITACANVSSWGVDSTRISWPTRAGATYSVLVGDDAGTRVVRTTTSGAFSYTSEYVKKDQHVGEVYGQVVEWLADGSRTTSQRQYIIFTSSSSNNCGFNDDIPFSAQCVTSSGIESRPNYTWNPIREAIRYEVQIVTKNGDVLTTIPLEVDVRKYTLKAEVVNPYQSYFNAKTLRSRVVAVLADESVIVGAQFDFFAGSWSGYGCKGDA